LLGNSLQFRGRFLIRDASRVESLLGAAGIVNEKLHDAASALRCSQEGKNIYLSAAESPCDFCNCTRMIVNGDGELFQF